MEDREGRLQDRDRSVPSFVGKVSEKTTDVSHLGQEDFVLDGIRMLGMYACVKMRVLWGDGQIQVGSFLEKPFK